MFYDVFGRDFRTTGTAIVLEPIWESLDLANTRTSFDKMHGALLLATGGCLYHEDRQSLRNGKGGRKRGGGIDRIIWGDSRPSPRNTAPSGTGRPVGGPRVPNPHIISKVDPWGSSPDATALPGVYFATGVP